MGIGARVEGRADEPEEPLQAGRPVFSVLPMVISILTWPVPGQQNGNPLKGKPEPRGVKPGNDLPVPAWRRCRSAVARSPPMGPVRRDWPRVCSGAFPPEIALARRRANCYGFRTLARRDPAARNLAQIRCPIAAACL